LRQSRKQGQLRVNANRPAPEPVIQNAPHHVPEVVVETVPVVVLQAAMGATDVVAAAPTYVLDAQVHAKRTVLEDAAVPARRPALFLVDLGVAPEAVEIIATMVAFLLAVEAAQLVAATVRALV